MRHPFSKALTWILTIFWALLFTYVGCAKLIGARGMVQEFAQIGFGQWLRYVTGVLEVSGAIGVLIPKFRFWAALQVAGVMVGATVTNLAILRLPGLAGFTSILLALALTLAWLRRPHSQQHAKAIIA
jgi:putative oxidoreductase